MELRDFSFIYLFIYCLFLAFNTNVSGIVLLLDLKAAGFPWILRPRGLLLTDIPSLT